MPLWVLVVLVGILLNMLRPIWRGVHKLWNGRQRFRYEYDSCGYHRGLERREFIKIIVEEPAANQLMAAE